MPDGSLLDLLPPAFGPLESDPREEIIIDSFAGGGGASTGIWMALGRHPDVAINHDPEAIAMHAANHPTTRHYCQSVMAVDPREVAGGRPVGLLWASPDCKHFSKAKGGQPLDRNIRDLAWVVIHYAELVSPRVIMVENVEEFRTWGPLTAEGLPCKKRSGQTFETWLKTLQKLGYKVEHRELRACDYGAPTIRKRLFVIARRDGRPIVWPEPTHGAPDSEDVIAGRRLPWRTAAEIIDWSQQAPSIFLTREEARAIGVNRPLADATMRRIAKGVVRYVIEAAQPFLVPVTHSGDSRCHASTEPLRTVTTAKRGEHAVVVPSLVGLAHGDSGGRREYSVDEPAITVQAQGNNLAYVGATLIQTGYGERDGQSPRVPGIDKPLGTVVAGGGKHALVAAFLAKHYGGVIGHGVGQPIGTVTTTDHHSLVSAHLVHMHGRSVGTEADRPAPTVATHDKLGVVAAHVTNLYGSNRTASGGDVTKPLGTVTADGQHAGMVAAFLAKYYGTGGQDQPAGEPLHTVPTRDRFGLVTVEIAGEPYIIADIGMRMLTPRELYRAQGFPDSYRIEIEHEGKPLSKAAQVRMCGNSVCPPLAAALVSANVPELAATAPAEAAE